MTATGPVGHHAVHIGTLLGPAVLIAGWAAWSDVRARSRRPGASRLPSVLALAAALSIGAAAIHAVVVPSHLAEDRLYGAFFVASSAAQIGWAVAVVLRPHRLVLEVGALGNAAVLALWALTRTLGVPLGVYAGQREAIGLLDTTCAALELGIVGCCLLALRPTRTPIHA